MSDTGIQQQLRLLAADGETFAAALAAYEDARADGLCHEGAWECALQALHRTYHSAFLPPQNAGDKTNS